MLTLHQYGLMFLWIIFHVPPALLILWVIQRKGGGA